MARKNDHIRRKAIELRTEKHMTLDEIVERLKMPKTTVYYWIKDIDVPIDRSKSQRLASIRAGEVTREKWAAIRQAAYDQGMAEAPELLEDKHFYGFVVAYMCEGSRRTRHRVEFANSNYRMIRWANGYIAKYTARKITYRVQCHIDHDEDELKTFWSDVVGCNPSEIKIMRKSNSNEMSGRQFRSENGVLSINTNDTMFRARLQAWMDFVEEQW